MIGEIGDTDNRSHLLWEVIVSMKAAQLLTALCTALIVLTGCTASGPREIKIVTTEMKFTPDVIQAKAGEQIKFTIANKGTVLHEFVSDELKFQEIEVYPGETKSVMVTMPAAGEYPFYCEAKGHHEAGMAGKVLVAQ
jgi:uncharacterized cupredoxin-like copper-binding protein